MGELKKELEIIRNDAKEYLDEYIKDNSDDINSIKEFEKAFSYETDVFYTRIYDLACYDVANGLLKVLEKKNK